MVNNIWLSEKIKSKKIKLFAMDVDGVLTDAGMYYSEKGEVMKKFNTRDGMGIELLIKNEIIPVIITREKSDIVLARAKKLHVKEVHIGIEEKLSVLYQLIKKYDLTLDEVAYIGDDINDIEVLREVGLSIGVADAVDAVKSTVDIVTKNKGGKGAVREVIDYILQSKGL